MKIFYVANLRMPTERAHGIQLAKMCEAFILEGVSLELIVPRTSPRTKENAESFYGLSVPIPTKEVSALTIFPTTRFGFNLHAFSFAISSFLLLLSRKRALQGAFLYTIDLDQFSFFLLPLLGRPVFIEVHGSKTINVFINFFMRRVRGIIAVSAKVKDSLIKDFRREAAQIIVEPNAIDLRPFENLPEKNVARERLKLSKDKVILLYSGKFYDWKGLDIFVELAKRKPHVLIYIVGGDASELESIVGEKLPENIKCVGHKDFKEVPLWLAAADVLLLSGTKRNNYSYTETSPMKLLEYMAARRPIVAARTPAIESLASDEELIFYAPDSVEDLEKKIEEVLRDKRTKERVERAYRVAQRKGWRLRARSIITFMNHLK